MEKEFNSETDIIRITALCNSLVGYAKIYIKENRKLTQNIDVEVRDAVIVDSINYFGIMNACDCVLTTNDLYDNKKYSICVDTNCLLGILAKVYARYIFEEGIVDSVLLSCNTNNLKKSFDENDGITVLIDFINYISKINYFNKIFTLSELYQSYKEQKYIKEMEQLKVFLKHSGHYYRRMQNGECIESIFEKMCISTDLRNISSTGTYNYTDEAKKRYGKTQMYPWDRKMVDKELYAIGYAYAKMYGGNKQKLKIKPIKQKIKEMQK